MAVLPSQSYIRTVETVEYILHSKHKQKLGYKSYILSHGIKTYQFPGALRSRNEISHSPKA